MEIANVVKSQLERLDDRQKLIFIGGVFGLLLLILLLIFVSVNSSIDSMEKRIKKNEQLLVEIAQLREEFKQTSTKVDSIKSLLTTERDTFLTTFLEKAAKDLGVNIESIRQMTGRPNELYIENVVEVAIEKVTLKELVDLLFKIESYQKLLKVTNLKIRPKFVDPSQLKVDFKVSSFAEKGA